MTSIRLISKCISCPITIYSQYSAYFLSTQAEKSIENSIFEPKPLPLGITDWKKRLTYQAKQRGWLELDLIIGTFVKKNIESYNSDQLKLCEQILNSDNYDLNNCLLLNHEIPAGLKENPLMRDLVLFSRDYYKRED